MGAVHFSIDPKLLRELTRLLPLTVFVETGTYEGASTRTAASFFPELHTVELSRELYDRAVTTLSDLPQVSVHHGESPAFLREVVPGLGDTAILFWLDAHWCGGPGAEAGRAQCPLLEELEAIGTLNDRSVVLIDDARLFLAPPPPPADADEWPQLTDVLKRLSTLSEHHELMVIDDVFVLFPAHVREPLHRFARENAIDWLRELQKGRRLERRLDGLANQLRAVHQRLGADRGNGAASQALRREVAEALQEVRGLGERLDTVASEVAHLRCEAAAREQRDSERREQAHRSAGRRLVLRLRRRSQR